MDRVFVNKIKYVCVRKGLAYHGIIGMCVCVCVFHPILPGYLLCSCENKEEFRHIALELQWEIGEKEKMKKCR